MNARRLLLVGLLLPALTAAAQTAAQVVQQTSLFGTAHDITLSVTMELTSKTGTKERGLAIYLRRSESGVRILAVMVSPAFLSQMKFLTRRDADGSTNTWLKTSQGVRKLGAANGDERIFDSQFTVEDFTDIDVKAFDTKLRDGSLDTVPCFLVELTPRAAAGYAKKVLYVEKESFQLLGIDYLDAHQQIIRQYRVLQTRVIAGVPFPARSSMKDLQSGDETVLTVGEIDTARSIPDSMFNKAGL